MPDPLIAQGPTHAHRLLEAFSLFADRVAFRWKERDGWREMTYAEFGEKVKSLAALLDSKGVHLGDRVAVWVDTSWQWQAVDCAAQILGAVTIPIYHSLSLSEAIYILKDCNAKALFSDYQHLLQVNADGGGSLLKVTMDGDAGYGLAQALAEGEAIRRHHSPLNAKLDFPSIQPEDLSAVIYTSGTTGVPKGAVLTHRNVAGSTLDSLINSFIIGGESNTLLLHLPMAHIMARNVSVPAILYTGGTLAIAEPQRERLPENLMETRPTIFVTVPYLLDKFMAGVLDK